MQKALIIGVGRIGGWARNFASASPRRDCTSSRPGVRRPRWMQSSRTSKDPEAKRRRSLRTRRARRRRPVLRACRPRGGSRDPQRGQQHGRSHPRDGGGLLRQELAGLLRRVSVRAGGAAPHGPAEAGRHPVHRRQRLAARSGRVRRVQFGQGGPADLRPGDGEGIRPRKHPCRSCRRQRCRQRRQDTQTLSGRRLAPGPDARYRGVSSSAMPFSTGSPTRPGPSRSTCGRPWNSGELATTEVQRPLKSAARRSTNDRIPSAASSLFRTRSRIFGT